MKDLFTIERLQAIAQEVTGNWQTVLRNEQSTREVPGWDSLNHTLILLQISVECGVEIDAEETTSCRNFGELVSLVNQRIQSK